MYRRQIPLIISLFVPFTLLCLIYWNSSRTPKQLPIPLRSQNTTNALVFETQSIDLGSIRQGEKGIASFNFTNASQSFVQIKSVQPGCSCTATDYPHQPINPGSRHILNANIQTDGKSGKFQSKILFTYEVNEKLIQVELKCTADVRTPGKLEPKPMSFILGDVRPGMSIRKDLTLLQAEESKEEVSIQILDSPSWLKASLSDRINRGVIKIVVEISVPHEYGELVGSVKIRTNQKYFNNIDIPVIGYVKGDIEANPRQAIKIIRPNASRAASLMLTHSGSKPIQMVQSHGIEPILIKGSNPSPNQIAITLTPPASFSSSILKGIATIVVSTDTSQEIIHLPYLFIYHE